MILDPWPEIDRLAAERGFDPAPARELVAQLQVDGRMIDPEQAVGERLVLLLGVNLTFDDALAMVAAEIDDALDGP